MSENKNTQISGLLRRAFLLLEDQEWEKADECADKVLDSEPEISDAYLCKLLSELRVARKELLSDVQVEISKNKNYINALKYADASQKNFLEDCAQKAGNRFREQERKKANQEEIKLFSDMIETYRNTQRSNRYMIQRGESAVKMYLITYIVFIVFIAVLILITSRNTDSLLVLTLGAGVGIPIFFILMWVSHARLVRFWDLDCGDGDRGWVFPMVYGMINCYFTLGIWGLVKSFKTRKECKGLSNNNAEMDRQIRDLQKEIEEKKNALKK